MMDGSMHPNIIRYAERNQLKIVKRLGFGIHGSVFAADYPNGRTVAIKHHAEGDPFYREFEVYSRLHELKVKEVHGFIVPRLLNVDEDLRILEMTIVSRPFILDWWSVS
jgi:RIO-like serine/threonine protein kinase